MIFKVQIDMTGTQMLVYSEGRQNIYQGAKPQGLNMGPGSKRYAKGQLKEGEVTIDLESFMPEGFDPGW